MLVFKLPAHVVLGEQRARLSEKEPAAELCRDVKLTRAFPGGIRRPSGSQSRAHTFSGHHGTEGQCFPGTCVPVQTLIDYIEAGDMIDEFLAVHQAARRLFSTKCQRRGGESSESVCAPVCSYVLAQHRVNAADGARRFV